jgi:MFS family permease
MFRARIRNLASILISTTIMMLGVGLLNITVAIRLEKTGYSSFLIGLISAFYYAGMFLGAFRIEKVLLAIGHIRSFALLASVLSISVLIPGLLEHPVIWLVARFVGGFCLAGLYVTVESWILTFSTDKDRGQHLSYYMIVLTLGSAIGPLLLNLGSPMAWVPFVLVAVLLSVAVSVIASTRSKAPEFTLPSLMTLKELFHISRTGFIGCCVSGALISGLMSFLPVIAQKIHFPVAEITILSTTVTLGGLVFQYPTGYFADTYDCRIVLMFLTGLSMIVIGAACFLFQEVSWLYLGIAFLMGGGLTSIYPVSMSYAVAHVKREDIINVTQGLMIAYGLGAMFGPLCCSFIIEQTGPIGLFYYLLLICGIFLGALFYTRYAAPRPAPYEHEYVPLVGATPVAAEMDPRTEGSEQN